jgi:aminopeptidase N
VFVLGQELTPIPALVGQLQPAFIYVNAADAAYAKVGLDAASQKFASQHLGQFEDALLRQLVWATFYDMVRDAELPSTAYVQLVLDHLATEQDPKLISTALKRLTGILGSFMPAQYVVSQADTVFDFLYAQVEKAVAAKKPADFVLIFVKSLISSAKSKQAIDKLYLLLAADNTLVKLPQPQRWSVLAKAVSWKVDGALALVASEAKADPSDSGRRSTLAAESSQWDAKVKEGLWEKFTHPADYPDLSNHSWFSMMGGFHYKHQRELTKPYDAKFFEVVKSLFQAPKKDYPIAFFNNLYPFDPEDTKIIDTTAAFIAGLDATTDTILLRNAREMLDSMHRAANARQLQLQYFQQQQ